MPTACCNMRIWLQVPETGICPAETPEYYTVQGKTGKGVSYMSIREALIHMFTDDPVNWLKWALVFAVLIGGYFVAIPLYGRLAHGMSWERKRDIARSRNHIIKASIAKKWPSGDVGHYNWHATYRYTLQGEERRYTAYFKHPSTPPLYLYLYYINDPCKLFSCDEYHYQNHKGLLLLPVIFLPWILALVVFALLGVEPPQAI